MFKQGSHANHSQHLHEKDVVDLRVAWSRIVARLSLLDEPAKAASLDKAKAVKPDSLEDDSPPNDFRIVFATGGDS